MLGYAAISECAISALPDAFTGAIAAEGTLIAGFDLVTNDPFVDFISRPNVQFVYAVEINVQPVSTV